MGAFTQDYEYVEGLGDLDECNGFKIFERLVLCVPNFAIG